MFGFPFAEEETKVQGGDSPELATWGTASNSVCLQSLCFLQDTIVLSYNLSLDAIIRKRILGWGGWERWSPSPHRESRLALQGDHFGSGIKSLKNVHIVGLDFLFLETNPEDKSSQRFINSTQRLKSSTI